MGRMRKNQTPFLVSPLGCQTAATTSCLSHFSPARLVHSPITFGHRHIPLHHVCLRQASHHLPYHGGRRCELHELNLSDRCKEKCQKSLYIWVREMVSRTLDDKEEEEDDDVAEEDVAKD